MKQTVRFKAALKNFSKQVEHPTSDILLSPCCSKCGTKQLLPIRQSRVSISTCRFKFVSIYVLKICSLFTPVLVSTNY